MCNISLPSNGTGSHRPGWGWGTGQEVSGGEWWPRGAEALASRRAPRPRSSEQEGGHLHPSLSGPSADHSTHVSTLSMPGPVPAVAGGAEVTEPPPCSQGSSTLRVLCRHWVTEWN